MILSRPKPLALYIFSRNDGLVKKILDRTSSGGVCVNDTIYHLAYEGLPFGGVGNSGMGRYHGKFSFETFSHPKAILHRGFNKLSESITSARYPPSSDSKLSLFRSVMRNVHHFNISGPGWCQIFSHAFAIALGVALVYLVQRCM